MKLSRSLPSYLAAFLIALSPGVSLAAYSGITASSTSSGTTITWSSTDAGSSQVSYGTSTAYGSMTPLNSSSVMNHSVMISGLTPSTTYHFQVMTPDPTGLIVPSSDQTFTTAAAPTAPSATGSSFSVDMNGTFSGTLNATDTNTPVLPLMFSILTQPSNGTLSGVNTSTGAFTYAPTTGFFGTDQFTFMVNNGSMDSLTATQMITVGATSTATSTTSTSTATSTTGTTGTSTSTTGTSTATSTDTMSTSTSTSTPTSTAATTTATSTPTSTTLSTAQIAEIESQLRMLGQQLMAIIHQFLMGNGSFWWSFGNGQQTWHGSIGSGSMMPTSTTGGMTGGTGGAIIYGAPTTVQAGGSVDFNGRNFGHEESVVVMSNGMLVTTAHADGGGNFTTGSLSVPATPGTKTYVFTGLTSGMTASVTLTIQ
jgi:hypothetical protein